MRARLIALALLLVVAPMAAQVSNLPTLTQRVNDTAGVIDDASVKDLEGKIRGLKDATGDVLIVTTVPSITPFATVEEYAVKLFEKSGIGNKKLDNGILILVAVKEHGIRIEVGYGLEGIVTDGFAGDTIRKFMVPEFKANRYGPGLVAGTAHLIDRIIAERKNPGAAATPKATARGFWLGAILILVIGSLVVGLIVLVIYLIARATGGFRNTPSSGGGLGGGSSFTSSDNDSSSSSSSSSSSDSSGFDGGSSGGGGASGSW